MKLAVPRFALVLFVTLIGCCRFNVALAAETEPGQAHTTSVLGDRLWTAFVEAVMRDFEVSLAAAQLDAICQARTQTNLGAHTLRAQVDDCIEATLQVLDQDSEYIRPKTYELQLSQGSAPFGSVGLEFRAIAHPDDPLVVYSAIPGGAGDRAGIKAGDVLTAIDGRAVRGLTPQELIAVLRGPPGTRVLIALQRDGQSLEVPIDRQVINIKYARSKIVPGLAVYLRVSSFVKGSTSSDALTSMLGALRFAEITPKSLILDLRSNRGGHLGELVETASLFLPADTSLLQSKTRSGTEILRTKLQSIGLSTTATRLAELLRVGRIAVLVDGKTASGAEALAQALRTHRSATIIGTPTARVNAIRQRKTLNDQAAVVLTVGRLAQPDGSDWTSAGVPIDLPAVDQEGYEWGDVEKDLVLRVAMRWSQSP